MIYCTLIIRVQRSVLLYVDVTLIGHRMTKMKSKSCLDIKLCYLGLNNYYQLAYVNEIQSKFEKALGS